MASYVVSLLVCIFASVYSFDFPEPPNYGWGQQTELDKYVQSDDGYFSWTVIETHDFENVTLYILNMTSQKWIDEAFSTHPIWWHYQGIAVPKELKRKDIAALFIMGGSNDDPPPPPFAVEAVAAMRLATDTGTIASFLKMVPNQPIYFSNDPTNERRSEDELIAWSWVTFGNTKDTPAYNPAYPLRCPMTKAGKRALDTIHEFAKSIIPDSNVINFLVSGASKRGWTVWSLGATDRRVIAINPLVFSLIHMEESVMNHFKALDQKWSFALEPYWVENLTQFMLEPMAWGPGGLYDYEDIYRYRSRLTIPKLSIASTGDEFFFPQDFHAWWVNFTEPKYLLMLPNSDHIMAPHYFRIYDTLLSFYENILQDGGVSMPKITWTMTEDTQGGEILFRTDPPPRIDPETGWYDIEGWESITSDGDELRDFRLITGSGPHIVGWRNTTLELVGPGLFRSYIDRNYAGEWVAHFIEGTWEGPSGSPMYLTSEVNYVPFKQFPGVACETQAECWGSLI